MVETAAKQTEKLRGVDTAPHLFLKKAYKVQMISIIVGLVFFLLASYYRTPYVFHPSKSIDFIQTTDNVLAKYTKMPNIDHVYITTIDTVLTHALAHGSYVKVPVDRFLFDNQIRLDSNQVTINNLRKMLDTSDFNPNRLSDKIATALPNDRFLKYGLNQFISGGNFWSPWVTPLLVFLGADLLLLLMTGYQLNLERDRYERAMAQLAANDHPTDIRLSWVSAQITLDTYYRRNLGQNTWTFILSVIVMIIGTLMIFWAIDKAMASDKVATLVPVLGTAAGVITQFIGATFLSIYNSTLKQSLFYTANLQKTSTVGTSLAILNSIEMGDKDAIAADPTIAAQLINAKIEIAKQLIIQAAAVQGS